MTTFASVTSATYSLPGATASGAGGRPRWRVGGVVRAVKVFAGVVFSVAVLGEYGEEAGVRRR
ncbi:hypothetical protein ACWGI0_33965 [Streptomyces sp. NPDC054802]